MPKLSLPDIFSLLRQTFQEWNEDNAPRLAAALSYYIAFSLAPLLVLIISLLGFLLQEDLAREQVLTQVSRTVGPQAAELLSGIIDSLRQPASGIISTLLGIAALVFGALSTFEQLKGALNTVWDVPPEKLRVGARGFVLTKLISFGMVVVIGLLLLISLVISTVLNAFDSYISSLFPGAPFLLSVMNTVVSFGMIVVVFALIYRILPDVRLEWRDVWIGAAITALLFVIGKAALSLYLGTTGTTSAYGAAGSFVLILLWIYYSAQIVLFGAEFTQVYSRHYGSLRDASGAGGTAKPGQETPEPAA
jgi:membrane protein